MAYVDVTIAQRVRNRLSETFLELLNSGKPNVFVNILWSDELRRCCIPEETFFVIDMERHTNIAFELKGIVLSTEKSQT